MGMFCKINYLAKFSKILAKLTKTELNLAKIIGQLSFLMGEKAEIGGESEELVTLMKQHWSVVQERASALSMLLSFWHLTGMGPGLQEIKVDDGKLSAGRQRDFTDGPHC